MDSLEKSFRRISELIDSGKAPNDAFDNMTGEATDEEDEKRKRKKKLLNRDATEKFVDSFKKPF